jgi:hypothetical protein
LNQQFRFLLCAPMRVLLLSCLALTLTFSSAAQSNPPPLTLQQPIGQRVGTMSNDYSSTTTQAEKMAQWANAVRQKQLVKDTAKLVELTAQFKQRMATQVDGKFSDDDIRLITHIEKLAHNIRESMAYAGKAPPPAPPPSPLIW